MYDNQLITLDVYGGAELLNNLNNLNSSNLNGSSSLDANSNNNKNLNSGLSTESISSGGRNAAGKRRQLPQIPLDKQRENREKGNKNITLLFFIFQLIVEFNSKSFLVF